MANYTCTKCGASAYSKCIHWRQTFPKNGTDALLSHFITIKGDLITIKKEHVNSFFTLWAPLSDQEKEEILCTHFWEINPGETCIQGCCSNPEEP